MPNPEVACDLVLQELVGGAQHVALDVPQVQLTVWYLHHAFKPLQGNVP